jgi:hypothetical protein
MEERFGRDFAHVRVHSDAAAAQSAQELHARAYTVGRHVVMGHGRFQPHTTAGEQLLAHELTHVIQQGNPAYDMTTPPRGISHQDDPSERQADRIAAAAGSPVPSGTDFAAVRVRGDGPAGAAPLVARQADAGVPDAGVPDAGVPDAGVPEAGPREGGAAASERSAALSDPMYPLQAGCVAEQGGCQQYVAGGVLDPDQFKADYNSRCRPRTKYAGPDMWPSDLECEQARNGAILDPGQLDELKALLVEYKARLDAGQLAPDEIRDCETAVQLGLQALQRAGLSQERITEAASNPPDPQVTQAFAPGAGLVALRIVIEGGKVTLVSESAAAGAGAAAAGTVAAGVLVGLVVVGVIVLIIWAARLPGMRLDPVAPQLLKESLGQLRSALRRAAQRRAQPQPQPLPLPQPQPLPEPERGPGGRWGCDDVRCNVYPDLSQHPPRTDCPKRVIGRSRGYPDYNSACLAAQRNANAQVPRGCIKRHCNCKTKCYPM